MSKGAAGTRGPGMQGRRWGDGGPGHGDGQLGGRGHSPCVTAQMPALLHLPPPHPEDRDLWRLGPQLPALSPGAHPAPNRPASRCPGPGRASC